MANVPTLQVTEDALRAMGNLNLKNDPNWIAIKQYLKNQAVSLEAMAAYGEFPTFERQRFISGMATAFRDLFNFADNPKECAEKIKAALSRPDKKLTGV